MSKDILHKLSHTFHRSILTLLIITLITNFTFGQLQVSPIQKTIPSKKSTSNSRTKSDVPISLPFWDDFSYSLTGYPDTLWVNSNSVDISDGSGINSPSINIATFDGLDSLGSPYNPTDLTANGYTDKLISRKIKLSEVPAGERPSVYLSFFYQWRGNGEAPDANDFIRLEFKDQSGAWIEIHTVYGGEAPDPTVFNVANLPVTGDQYYHDEFQFRIRSYGRLSGPYDTWLVDYVYLNKGRNANEPSFPDRAASSAISKFFGRHYALPLTHFFASKELDSVRFDVQNLRGPAFGGASINYRANAKFYHYTGEAPPTIIGKSLIKSRGVKGESGAMLPYERVRVRLDTLPDPNDETLFNPNVDAIKIQMKMKVISNDSIDPELPQFIPLDFRVNDTISAWYTLKDYYAYDDGAAEYSVRLTQPGNRLAYQFDILTDTATLYGFYVYFPYLGGSNSETVDFYIYGNNEGVPTDQPLYSALSRTVAKKSNNEFIYVQIEPPQFLQDTTFFIGYKEPVSSTIAVGLDKSNDTGDKIFVSTGSGWFQNTDVAGSLMIRPVFGPGNGSPVTGVNDETKTVKLYPNPNTGTFYIEDEINELNIIDITGRAIQWELEDVNDTKRINLQSPSPGMYIVRWTNKRGAYQKKIVVEN